VSDDDGKERSNKTNTSLTCAQITSSRLLPRQHDSSDADRFGFRFDRVTKSIYHLTHDCVDSKGNDPGRAFFEVMYCNIK